MGREVWIILGRREGCESSAVTKLTYIRFFVRVSRGVE